MATSNGTVRFGGQHAIVIGGSVAGLVTARVLSSHFDQVTLVERDPMPDQPEARKGVPQMRHVHVLLKRGETILAKYFPGLVDELVAAGSNLLDMAGDTRWYHFGGWKPRFKSGMEFLSQSRPLLEWKIRSRVAQTPGIEIRSETTVEGYVFDDSRARVTGVRILSKTAGAREEQLLADLVVDASGRGSRTPQWLAAAGYAEPEETNIKVDIGYATVFMRLPATLKRDWKVLFVYMKPPETRLGVLLPVEDGQHMSTVVGWFGDHCPAEKEAYLEWTKGMPSLEYYEAIKDAEWVSPTYIHKFPANRRRHYERLSRFPDGLAVIGDALCSFNPIYGQGMTTASLGGATLDEALQDRARTSPGDLRGFSVPFQKRIAKVIDPPWMGVLAEDFRYEQAEGKRPFWVKAMGWYTSRVYRLTHIDERVSRRFLQVMHLMEKPWVLFEPYVMRKVLALGPEAPTPAAATAPTVRATQPTG